MFCFSSTFYITSRHSYHSKASAELIASVSSEPLANHKGARELLHIIGMDGVGRGIGKVSQTILFGLSEGNTCFLRTVQLKLGAYVTEQTLMSKMNVFQD